MSKEQVVFELFRQVRKNFRRRKIIIKGYDDLWQADLAEFLPYAKINKGYKYILIVIDCFSKFLWMHGVKSKKGQEITNAMADIFNRSGRTPKNLQTDAGKEFYNRSFAKLMADKKINHYSTYSTMKASIAERVIRTIKTRLYKTFSLRGNYKWFDIIAKVADNYNNTKHRTIGMKPNAVTPKTDLHHVYGRMKTFLDKPRYKVGDVVRISKYKSVFSKGYTPSWSTELFKIVKVQITNPVTYLLQDMYGKPILGCFYTEELGKVKYPDVYLVEKILKRRHDKVYVKWLGGLGYSWINASDVL